jgi:hypothetical protein
MARYPAGVATIRVGMPSAITDATGAAVDATSITLTVHLPDGTVKTYPTPVHDGVGLYHQDIPLTDSTQVGHYPYLWSGLVGTAGFGREGSFDTYDPFEVSVLSLQDAKDALNIPQATTTDDAEIQRKIATIEANIEKMTGGPVITRSIVERAELTDGYTALVLRKRPIVAVTSIVSVASGQPIAIGDLDIDPNSNIVRRKLGLPFYGPYFTWLPTFTVTYTAGLGTSVPPAIADAAADIIQHLWETQRGPSVMPPLGGDETVTLPGWGYAIPNRAAEKLSPYALEAYV